MPARVALAHCALGRPHEDLLAEAVALAPDADLVTEAVAASAAARSEWARDPGNPGSPGSPALTA